MKNNLKMFRYAGRIWHLVAATILFDLGFALAAAYQPIVFKQIVDQLVRLLQHPTSLAVGTHIITRSIIVLFGLQIIMMALDFANDIASMDLFQTVLTNLRQRVFKHLVSLSLDYFEQHRAGDIIEKVSTGILDFARWINDLSNSFLIQIFTVIFALGMIFWRNHLAGGIMLVAVIVSLIVQIKALTAHRLRSKEANKVAEKASGQFVEAITHISTVRSFAKENHMIEQYSNLTAKHRALRMRNNWIIERWATLRNLILDSARVSVIGIIALLALRGRYTAGDILLVSLYLQQINSNIRPLGRLFVNTSEIDASTERIHELLSAKPTVVDKNYATDLEQLESIEFKDVSFHYPGKRRLVLNQVSFKLGQGQTLALVGPSGVGKTTITKLLLRFYAPTSGQILINGQDVSSYTQDSLRRMIGMVMQDVALFNDSVIENIQFADPQAKLEQVRQAAELAHADVFIDKLPDKYNTLVGERGVKLSGGEKQRVAIARAILKDPQLIILDEATSALDSESERYVQDGLHRLMADKTAVIIAHRLSTVMRADQILVLKDGKVIERGNHAELVDKAGLYAKLFHMQTKGHSQPLLETA